MSKGYKYSYVFRIITRYLERRYSTGLEEKVQEWLLDSERAEEKEFVLEEHWKSLDVKADKSIGSSLKEVKVKAGIAEVRICVYTQAGLYVKWRRSLSLSLLSGPAPYYILMHPIKIKPAARLLFRRSWQRE